MCVCSAAGAGAVATSSVATSSVAATEGDDPRAAGPAAARPMRLSAEQQRAAAAALHIALPCELTCVSAVHVLPQGWQCLRDTYELGNANEPVCCKEDAHMHTPPSTTLTG